MNMDTLKQMVIYEKENGIGLFAQEHIYQGQTILELPVSDCLFEPDQYSIQIAPGLHLDCKDHPVGAINHSCEPNAVIRGDRLVAWACIEKGEEITIDYKRTEQKLSFPFDCDCCGMWIS